MQIPLDEAIEYVKSRGYNEKDANYMVTSLSKIKKLTFPRLKSCVNVKDTMVEMKKSMDANGDNKIIVIDEMAELEKEQGIQMDIGGFIEEERLKREMEFGDGRDVSLINEPTDNTQVNLVNLKVNPLDSEFANEPTDNTQVNLPNNCFIGFKVNQVVFDKIKHQSKQLGIPISAIMRSMVEYNFY